MKPEPEDLRSVLDAALLQGLAPGAVSLEERRSLVAVARRHRAMPLTFEPVGVDLALAMIASFLGVSEGSSEPLRPAARDVARGLFAHAAALRRLEGLWQQLQEAASP